VFKIVFARLVTTSRGGVEIWHGMSSLAPCIFVVSLTRVFHCRCNVVYVCVTMLSLNKMTVGVCLYPSAEVVSLSGGLMAIFGDLVEIPCPSHDF